MEKRMIGSYLLQQIPKYERRFHVQDLRVTPCKNGRKRFTATFLLNGKRVVRHFGQIGAITYGDDHSLKQKRAAFRARHSKIVDAQGFYAYRVAGSPCSLSYWLLW